MKLIFVSDSKNNVILEGESYHYLIVKGVRANKNKKFVCAFDGELSRVQNGKRYTIADLLVRYIQVNGPFYLDPNTTPRSQHPQKRIEEILYSLYYQKPVIQGLKIKIANRKGIGFSSYNFMSADEAKLLQHNVVIELTKRNIRSDDMGTHVHTNGTFCLDSANRIVGTCAGMFFYTDYAAGLFDLLQKIGVWTVTKGALKAVIGKAKVPFATIVWAYRHGLIPDNVKAEKAILAAHKYFTTMELEVDHLTENKSNNCLYALALVHGNINTSLGDRRNSIKEPFFFYTAYRHDVSKLLVKCGFDQDNQHYERRFFFDLTRKGEEEYRKCFNEFKKKAEAAGYLTKEPEKDNLLSYWADPCRPGEENNPLAKLPTEPLPSFYKYSNGAFNDMPEI